jgi:hypothetical protein
LGVGPFVGRAGLPGYRRSHGVPAGATPPCAGDVEDCLVEKEVCSRDFGAKIKYMEIVVHRVA